MKLLLSIPLFFFSLILAKADVYYWNFSANHWGEWSANFQNKSGIKANPTSTDSVVFDLLKYCKEKNTAMPIIVVSEKTIADMKIENLCRIDEKDTTIFKPLNFSLMSSEKTANSQHATTKLSILGDLKIVYQKNCGDVTIATKNVPDASGFSLELGKEDEDTGNLIIDSQTMFSGGTLFLGTSGENSHLRQLTINRNVYFKEGQISMNVDNANSSMKNPDVKIKGTFYFDTSGSWTLAAKGAKSRFSDTYISVGGLVSGTNCSKISNHAAAEVTGNTYFIINTPKGSINSYNGWLREYNQKRTLNIVMRGGGEQTIFESSKSTEKDFNQFMRGDILVRKGILQLGSADGVFKKIKLEGGRISGCSEKTEVGVLKAGDFEWKKGSILVDIDFAGDNDLINISGDFIKKGKSEHRYMVEINPMPVSVNNQSYMIVKWAGKTDFTEKDFISNKLKGLKTKFEIKNNNELWVSFSIPQE